MLTDITTLNGLMHCR